MILIELNVSKNTCMCELHYKKNGDLVKLSPRAMSREAVFAYIMQPFSDSITLGGLRGLKATTSEHAVLLRNSQIVSLQIWCTHGLTSCWGTLVYREKIGDAEITVEFRKTSFQALMLALNDALRDGDC